MPELPEVETVRCGLEQAVLGSRIESVKINRYDLRVAVPQDFGQSVGGKVIESLTRRGKYIVMHLSGDICVVLHLGMSGRVRIFEKGNPYEARKHDHLIFYVGDDVCFAFEDPRRFGMVYISEEHNWQNEPPFSKMGPEPLDIWTGKDLFDALRGKRVNIKSALLDQRIVSGLGNIYVCEALYNAGVHPERPSGSIKRAEADAIVACSRDVLEKAIAAGGSTLKDYQKTDGSLGYFQYQFAVYDQEGEACSNSKCTTTILRIVQSGRSTFYCPTCQK